MSVLKDLPIVATTQKDKKLKLLSYPKVIYSSLTNVIS